MITIILPSFLLFIQAVLMLLVVAGVILLVKWCLGIAAKYYDEFTSIYFKGRQMDEHIKDRQTQREIVEDNAKLALPVGDEPFYILGLDGERIEQKEVLGDD